MQRENAQYVTTEHVTAGIESFPKFTTRYTGRSHWSIMDENIDNGKYFRNVFKFHDFFKFLKPGFHIAFSCRYLFFVALKQRTTNGNTLEKHQRQEKGTCRYLFLR